MTHEYRSDPRQRRSNAQNDALADRLDAAAVEEVIRRAIELEAEDPSPTPQHSFTAEEVTRIAGELGIDSEFIGRAIAEVQSAPPQDQRSKLDKFFLPEPLVESSVVEGLSRTQIEAMLTDWMTNREGMRLVGRFDDGGEWEVDPHWLAKLRTALNSDSGRLGRVAAGPVKHRIGEIAGDQHVIALEASDSVPQIVGRAGIATGVAASLTVWLLAFFGVLGGFGIGTTLLFLLIGLLLGSGIVAGFRAAIRTWGRRIKRRLRTALFRMGNPEVAPVTSRLGDFVATLFGGTYRRR